MVPSANSTMKTRGRAATAVIGRPRYKYEDSYYDVLSL